VRVAAALFCAAFGALAVSAAICPLSVYGPFAPAWAPWVCEANVWRQWVVVAPAIFLALLFLLGERVRSFRRYAVIALLALFGVYTLSDVSVLQSWWAVFPVAALVAAFGVLANQRWARYLVYLLTLVFAVYWAFWAWLAFNTGRFSDSPLGVAVLSLAPGVAFMMAAAFCCYVCRRTG
jgi:hypothetical protein